MYEYLSDNTHARVIGSFNSDPNVDFKEGVKGLIENFQASYQVDAVDNILGIIKVDALKESYKQDLIGDVLNESFDDPYYNQLPAKLEQLFENSVIDIVRESNIAPLAPIVGYSLPILKKNYIEGHAKDIIMTEVPTKPIIKVAFERKFLKNKAGDKFYIPEIFYDDSYKKVLDYSKGKPIDNKWYPDDAAKTVPFQDLPIMQLSGGTMETRDSLAYDFCIEGLQIEVPNASGTPTIKEFSGYNIQPDFATTNGTSSGFTFRIKVQGDDGTSVEDIITGQVDQYYGRVSVSCTAGKIKKVRFGGHLSNENNLETVEIDREREQREWKIPDGQRINTGLTIEKIKDYKAVSDIDITTEIIADMSTCLTQFEDSTMLDYLDTSLGRWKGRTDLPFGYKDGFVETYQFSCTPTSNVFTTTSSWVNTELKFYLNQLINQLKVKLRNTNLMFVVYGHPNNISLIQDSVKWVIDEDTKIGGIQLDYKFGVMTGNANRVHVVSTMKFDYSKGIRVVAFPTSQETITFKHYKYSLNIENIYRNPMTPLTPNVMGTSRYITTELLPVQGEFELVNNKFGRQTSYATPVKATKLDPYVMSGATPTP